MQCVSNIVRSPDSRFCALSSQTTLYLSEAWMCAGLRPDSKGAVTNLELDSLLIDVSEAARAGQAEQEEPGWLAR